MGESASTPVASNSSKMGFSLHPKQHTNYTQIWLKDPNVSFCKSSHSFNLQLIRRKRIQSLFNLSMFCQIFQQLAQQTKMKMSTLYESGYLECLFCLTATKVLNCMMITALQQHTRHYFLLPHKNTHFKLGFQNLWQKHSRQAGAVLPTTQVRI